LLTGDTIPRPFKHAQQHNNIRPVIPLKQHRKEQRDYDRYLYQLRHLVENAFMQLKGWRGACH
jgi:hypothetical protein